MLFLLCLVTSCSSTNTHTPIRYATHFPAPQPSPTRNPQTEKGIALGKKLFFDPVLSRSGKISCASCHLPSMSFSDGKATSTAGESGKPLARNTPPLINLAWQNRFFWDGGVKNLESLPFAALTNPNEMGTDLRQLVQYLNDHVAYRKAFEEVFDIPRVSSAYIARALAQYQRTLVSDNSFYDKAQQDTSLQSPSFKKAMKIFTNKCGNCHQPPLFTDHHFHNNGLDSHFPTANEDERAGRYRITLDSADLGKYKTPTLRNLVFTAPYMHDGRFASLTEVLDHYQSGVNHSPTLAPALQSLTLTPSDRENILYFLHTLTDSSFVSNPDFVVRKKHP